MKRILTSILMAVGIAGPFISNLSAQGHGMSADIPFAFVAGKSTMPAGRYVVRTANASGSVFELNNGSNSVLIQLGVNEDRKSDKASVTFACDGKDCLLAKITPPGTFYAFGLGKNEVEKRLHHKLGMASMISVKLNAH
jgi:hypothetical protein